LIYRWECGIGNTWGTEYRKDIRFSKTCKENIGERKAGGRKERKKVSVSK
jgi:hypothetical protein